MKKTMAYKHKGMKAPRPDQKVEAGQEQAKMPPKHKPSMKTKSPEGPYKSPKDGEQSTPPSHKEKSMTMEKAPKGVSGVNGGQSVQLPKSGCVGETEV